MAGPIRLVWQPFAILAVSRPRPVEGPERGRAAGGLEAAPEPVPEPVQLVGKWARRDQDRTQA